MGTFQSDQLVGLGRCTLPNGDRYDGEFRDSQWDGRGTYTYTDGFQVEGLWRSGQLIQGLSR